jgi:hypothetical protein
MKFVDSACHLLQRVFDKLLQLLYRQSDTLLQGARRYLITACNTLLFSRIFLILHALSSNNLLHIAKRNPIPFKPETKGGK